jgi:cell division protein FtsI/penicillin-binding protein 2
MSTLIGSTKGADEPAAPVYSPDATVLLDKMVLRGDRYIAPMSDGREAVLTLDPRLQAAAEQVLARARAPRGAVVVTSRDGKVLALAGRRTADPKGGPDGIVDPSLALDAWAPAASIFKVVSTAAMVEAGARGADRVCFHGGVRSVMESNLVDTKQDRRCETLGYGLAHSQNAIIAKVAHQRLEPADLSDMADRFGFDQPLAFAAPASFGTAAIPEAKGVPFGRTAAGFDGVTLSVLGGAVLAGTIARGGEAPTPTLIAAIIDSRGEHPAVAPTGAPRKVIEPTVAREVAAMMAQTCKAGSAARAFQGRQKIRDVQVAGKTGTLSVSAPDYMQYSWFVGFAPADHAELTISVLLGNAELWHLKAHSAARSVLAEGLRPRAGS